MSKLGKFSVGAAVIIIVAAIYAPAPALAKPDSIFIYGFGYDSWEGRINPWPWASQWYTPQFYEPNVTFDFQQIPVMGDFAGSDSVSIDCDNNGTYDATTGGSTILQNVWGHLYWMSTSSLRCTYPAAGTYSPRLHVVRSGNSGCGYTGMGWFTCWNTTGATATTDYTFGPINILARNYNVNIWPNSQSPYVGKAPQNTSFVVQVTFPNQYNNSVGGSFTYHIDCGDGTPVKDINGYASGSIYVNNITYDSNYNPIGSAGQWALNAANISGCNYTSPGVYRVLIGTDGGGATRTQYGASNIILFPSVKLSAQVIAVPATGDAPLNNVKVHADAAGIMPAIGQWGPVDLLLRCDGNLQYEQAIASGVSSGIAAQNYGGDGQVSDAYHINFNTSGTPMVSTLSHDFTCSYPIAGTHTPTVVVQQNGLTGAGGTKVYVVGQLKCDGTDILKSPTNYRLDWDTANTDHCDASTKTFKSYSGFNYFDATNFIGRQSPKGSQTFYHVPSGQYEYDLSCIGTDPTQNVQSSCAVTVTP